MEFWFKGFTLCFLYQILPRIWASEENVDIKDIILEVKGELKENNDPKPWASEENKMYNINTMHRVKKLLKGNNDSGIPRYEQYAAEMAAGNPSDLFGANQHYSYPTMYRDFGRRFVPVYPYTEKEHPKTAEESLEVKNKENAELIPVKASPEKVLAVAMRSAIEQALNPVNNSEVANMKEILRTGEYWDSLWVENVPKSVLRSYEKKHLKQDVKKKYRSRSPISNLGSIRAKIMPGSKLYDLVSVLQQYSPRLLYVINTNN